MEGIIWQKGLNVFVCLGQGGNININTDIGYQGLENTSLTLKNNTSIRYYYYSHLANEGIEVQGGTSPKHKICKQ